MKFLIAGLGSIGQRHLNNLLALGERDVIIYRTHHSTLPDAGREDFPVFTDLSDALAVQPDAVIISNPTALHLSVALPAAEAGCHLLMEKPVSHQLDEDVEKLRKVVAEKKLKTLVGFQFRFHPVLAEVRRQLNHDIIGKPLSFRAHWGEYLPGWHPWEDYRQSYAARKSLGGGVVNTLSHPLDYVRWLLGEVDSVSAKTAHLSALDLDVEDVAEITLGLGHQLLGSVHLNYFQRPAAHWLEIVGEMGQIHWDNATGAAQIYSAPDKRWISVNPPVGFERNDLFLGELRHFLAVLRGEANTLCDLEDGVRTLVLTEAVHQAAQSGRTLSF